MLSSGPKRGLRRAGIHCRWQWSGWHPSAPHSDIGGALATGERPRAGWVGHIGRRTSRLLIGTAVTMTTGTVSTVTRERDWSAFAPRTYLNEYYADVGPENLALLEFFAK